MKKAYNKVLSKVKKCEAELFLWQVFIDKITGERNPFLDIQTLAVVVFDDITFEMTKREVCFL
jgi:hypothetical protein